jgi:hypothetical protein
VEKNRRQLTGIAAALVDRGKRSEACFIVRDGDKQALERAWPALDGEAADA